MSSNKSKVYRWCIFPECKNTSTSTPQKLWIALPRCDNKKRRTWLQLARRNPESWSMKTMLHFCEDHFDLENDMENYIRYKVMGSVSAIRMKPNCVPSRFDCLADAADGKHESTPSEPRKDSQRKSQIKEMQEPIQNENNGISLPSCEIEETKQNEDYPHYICHFPLPSCENKEIMQNENNGIPLPSCEIKETIQNENDGISLPSCEPEETIQNENDGISLPSCKIEETIQNENDGISLPSCKIEETIQNESDGISLLSCEIEETIQNENYGISLPYCEIEETIQNEHYGISLPSCEIEETIQNENYGISLLSSEIEETKQNENHGIALPSCSQGNGDTAGDTNQNEVGPQEIRVSDNHSIQCHFCFKDIIGFRYVCVQCADVELCGACEARETHAAHYVLRIPGPKPQEEVSQILQRVREDIELFTSADDGPENEPSQEVPEEDEIIIKTEIKEEIQDPLEPVKSEEMQQLDSMPHASNFLEQALLSVDVKEPVYLPPLPPLVAAPPADRNPPAASEALVLQSAPAVTPAGQSKFYIYAKPSIEPQASPPVKRRRESAAPYKIEDPTAFASAEESSFEVFIHEAEDSSNSMQRTAKGKGKDPVKMNQRVKKKS